MIIEFCKGGPLDGETREVLDTTEFYKEAKGKFNIVYRRRDTMEEATSEGGVAVCDEHNTFYDFVGWEAIEA